MKRLGVILATPFLILMVYAGMAQAINISANYLNIGTLSDISIETFAFPPGGAPIASFVPDAALLPALPHIQKANTGIAIAGNNLYYFTTTDLNFIHIAPYNAGAGGNDIGTLPTPDPNHDALTLAFSNGFLYAKTVDASVPTPRVVVYKMNPFTGAVISQVVLSGPLDFSANAFTVLPNGNFLVNRTVSINSYDQYDSVTGQVVPGTNLVPGGGAFSEGVDIAPDGLSLYFDVRGGSQPFPDAIVQTDLAGNVLAQAPVSVGSSDLINIDIALQQPMAVPLPPAVLMLGSRLLRLAAFGWRRRRQT